MPAFALDVGVDDQPKGKKMAKGEKKKGKSLSLWFSESSRKR